MKQYTKLGIKIGTGIGILAMIIIFGYRNSTTALSDNDCETTNIAAFQMAKDFENIYPIEAIHRAIDNLILYCCEKNLGNISKKTCEEKNKAAPKTKRPESAFLYDHLIDVGLRRLDGFPHLAYDLKGEDGSSKLDPIGLAWRTWMQNIAASKDGITAKVMVDEYKKFRSMNDAGIFTLQTIDLKSFNKAEATKFEAYNKNYNVGISLAEKYNNLCWIAWNVYLRKSPPRTINDSYVKICEKMVARRMAQEDLFFRALLIKKSNKQIIDGLKTVNKQFLEDKLMKLQTDIGRMKDLMFTVTKQAPVCKKCQN